MVAGGTAAVRTGADGAGISTVAAPAHVALVVVGAFGRIVLTVHVTVMDVVDVIGVDHGLVPAARSVGVAV